MKKYVLLLGLLLVFAIGCSSPPEDIERAQILNNNVDQNVIINEDNVIAINPSLSTFEFQGYGPGKDHIGNFEIWDGFFIVENNELVGAYGSIDPSTVVSDSTGLDRHLKSADFFDVETYPEILIRSKSINNNIMVAELTFHGVTKDISFPVEITNDNNQFSLSTEFILSMNEFNISYTGVNDEVRIKFEFKN